MAHPLRVLVLPRQSIELQAIECSICIEKLVLDAIFYTPCGHTFHEHCICSWLTSHITCPQCRQPLRKQQIRCLRLRPSDNDYEFQKLLQLQAEKTLLELEVEQNDIAIKSQKSKEEKLTSSVKRLKKEIANVEERLTAFESLRKIVSNSREDKNIPHTNDPVALIKLIRDQEREMNISIALEREKQQRMSERLLLDGAKTRKLNDVLQECNEKIKLQEKEIKELEDKLSTFQSITSTTIQATVKPKVVATAKKSQVDENIFSPNEPIAKRTRSRLHTTI